MNLKPGDMLYFAPHRATGILINKINDGVEDVAEAIERVGGKAYILNMSGGTSCLEN